MRLGDLDALKRKFALLMWKKHNPNETAKVYDIVNQTLDFIDNAPTVEPTFGLFKELLCTDCEKRPQGEWINGKDSCAYLTFCSECGMSSQKNTEYPYNFCPNCGADMRGKEE